MSNAAAARAESELRQRHLREYPRDLLTCDSDGVRAASGRKILLEAPAGFLAAVVEYKAIEEGPVDLNGWQANLIADSAGDKPAFVIQFTHSLLVPRQPWAFRLLPVNELAEALAPVVLTEQAYIQFLYVLQRGNVGGSYAEQRQWFDPWDQLAHLDHELPGDAIWPAATPKADGRSSSRPPLFIETAQQFVLERGHFLEAPRLASVTPLIANRMTIGAYRRQPSTPLSQSAPISFDLNRDVADRFDRLRWKLEQVYKKSLPETPSADSRDMWSPYGADGRPRWRRA